MGYVHGTLINYLDDAASKLPAPGGGSIAAMIGALGASMAAMSANFTIGKKKYADVEQEVTELLQQIESSRIRLAELVDADVEVYGKVSAAYGMPKVTDEEKLSRSSAIQEACKAAMSVPMDIARECAAVIGVCERLVKIGNKNLITDVGVSALAVDAACRAAELNVEINLGSIGDSELAAATKEELRGIVNKVGKTSESVMTEVRTVLKK